jgi:hypothetical protein
MHFISKIILISLTLSVSACNDSKSTIKSAKDTSSANVKLPNLQPEVRNQDSARKIIVPSDLVEKKEKLDDKWKSKFETFSIPTQYANSEPPKVLPEFNRKPKQLERITINHQYEDSTQNGQGARSSSFDECNNPNLITIDPNTMSFSDIAAAKSKNNNLLKSCEIKNRNRNTDRQQKPNRITTNNTSNQNDCNNLNLITIDPNTMSFSDIAAARSKNSNMLNACRSR